MRYQREETKVEKGKFLIMGYVETFEASFKQVSEDLNLTIPMNGDANGSGNEAPRPVASEPNSYRYLNEITPHAISVINDLYSEDFRALSFRTIAPEDAANSVELSPLL